MWLPFRRRKNLTPKSKKKLAMKRIIVGFIIGGAISSIIGSKLMQRREINDSEEDERDAKED